MATLLNRRRYMGGGGTVDEIIMTSSTNPEVLAICYAQGWASHADYMTKREAEAVTSFGRVFEDSQIITFDELIYFTNITNLNVLAFHNSTVTWLRFPYVTSCSSNSGANSCVFYNCASLNAVMFDKITFLGGSYNYGAKSGMYTVILSDSVPSTNGRWFYGKFYVLDSLVDSYKATTGWTQYGEGASRILPISQLPTDHPDCPWLNDLREKGFIPTT